MPSPAATPTTVHNVAALEITKMHVEQAQALARELGDPDLVPALIISLALNKQTVQMHSDARRK
jgi:hypothetical protein